MINTQYNTNNDILIGRATVAVNSAAITEKAETAESKVKVNKDTFEHRTTESTQTYSPETIAKKVDTTGVNSIPVSDVATTDAQRKLIPRFLAAKMAGLNYDKSSGSPSINSGYEAQAYQRALNTIEGDHADLYYKKDWCYIQNVSGTAYGKTDPKHACAAFAFATALSIKEGKQITPYNVDTTIEGYMNQYNIDNAVYDWKWDGGTAYRIADSNGDTTLKAIDAQLQLGNPAVLHITGSGINQHWVTVIGKENGEYNVLDPWDGEKKTLNNLYIMKYQGGKVSDYTILSDKY